MSIVDFAMTRNLGRQAFSRRGVSLSEAASYLAFLVSVGFTGALIFGLVP